MTKPLEQTWQSWIARNFARKCTKQDMLKVMVDAGIEESVALYNLEQHLTGEHKELDQYQQEASYLFQHENTFKTSDGKVMQVTMRCDSPDIAVIEDFMSHEECDELCSLSKGSLRKSEVVDDATGEGVTHKDRTSEGTDFSIGENKLITTIENRISEITGQPIINGEGTQILHYIKGAEYLPHYDYFPENEGGQNNMRSGGQRIITFIMYLNNVEAGGATIFPEVNLNIYPKKGSALYFSYFNSLGQVDPRTLHGGAPVTMGEKWIATKWIREREYT